MRRPGREAMGRLLRAVMVAAVVATLAAACTNTPDTTLHPHPPAVTYAPLEHPFRSARLFVDDQTAGAPSTSHYRRWIERLIHHLGATRAAIVVEPDAVAADCFDAKRASVLKRSVKLLADAGQHVYLDAGHARWRSTGEMAQRLLAAGIQYAQGFSVNVANRQTTKQSYRWGRELSDLLGDREFVIDTSRNGLGPPRDDPGRDDEWCKPAMPGAGPGPYHQDEHARAGRAALDQASRRIGRHLRRRDHLPLLPDPGATIDGQQPVRPGTAQAACLSRGRFADQRRQYRT
jgi:Glycosyl hydrolases family 6